MPMLRPMLACLSCAVACVSMSQSVPSDLYSGMQWRMIGPFRGGRTVGAAGVSSQPGTFYMGVNNGGVWKTNNFGRTWMPKFDDQPTGSIGALAVAPSDPNTVYVGSGEGLQRPDLSVGDGFYRSTDGGESWKHLGLRDGQQFGSIIVDPLNAKRIFVAVLGHPYGPNTERGVFRSEDGGETFTKVLYKNPDTGAIELAFDPRDANTVYAVLWAARQGPWENGEWQGKDSGLYKSTDGGTNWRQIGKGLPTIAQGLGRIGMTVAPSEPDRLYALADASEGGGLYRSDDGGESWRLSDNEGRIWGRGSDFAEVKVDPKNPDVVYVANTSTYKSTDGGKSFVAWKGAPGGDDYHSIWIDPNDPKVILLALDQGATITVNGGETWSSWYNQPTAQFYHVSTDNQFPYWVYGGQQESGSAGVASRGNDGQITFREWHPVGAEEYGYVAPDPLHPNLIYGGKVSRYDMITGQNQNVSPQIGRFGGKVRFLRTAPLMFSTVDPHILYLAGNVVFKTSDGGIHWTAISPDLTREVADPPAGSVFDRPTRRGVVYALGPSYKDVNVIWAGTDDGFIHVTRDGGKSWKNVTPNGLTAWSKVTQLDAGHFDLNTAYASVSRFKLDDLRPHIYRTHDGGASWQEVVAGLPDNAPVDTVREDPVRKGLLFAGTENAVYFSIDDGDHWNPLRLNMPATAIRDLVVHDEDLVVGTHGRSFWILDDITPLRQLSATDASTKLFQPELATRVHWNNNTDTPLPPEEPAGKNPPDGAIVDYYLSSDHHGPVKLEILDMHGNLVRKYSSDDKLVQVRERDLQVPMYWIRPLQPLSSEPGFHRFVWDLRYTPLGGRSYYPIAAIYRDTAPSPSSPWVSPGSFQVRLKSDGRVLTQTLRVRIDPRVKTAPSALAEQFRIAYGAYLSVTRLRDAANLIEEIGPKLTALPADLHTEGEALRAALGKVSTQLASPIGGLSGVMALVEESDMGPTSQAVEAYAGADKVATSLLSEWDLILKTKLEPLNARLKKAGLPELPKRSSKSIVPTGYGDDNDED
ncbi:MAG: hypothetical protein P4L46_07910 [Fimbriimonas sp.]|nr:hypothetical protein [Fimbriimonas sp.]